MERKPIHFRNFKERTISLCHELILNPSIQRLKIVITDIKPPPLSIIPFNKKKIAVVSIYTSNDQLPTSIFTMKELRSAYRVTEAVAYEKDWPDGEVTPGINLLTLFRKKTNLNYQLFLDRWYNGHTPLSLKIHPLWNYNRNVVEGSLNDIGIWHDGIVEEQVRERSELLNPFKFFGNPAVIVPNMINVYFDVKKFIDYLSIETYLANEYWIKS